MPARKIVDIDMDAKKPYAKLGQVFHLGFLSLTCDSFRVLRDRKSTRLNSSHLVISYAVFCLKKKTNKVHERLDGGIHDCAITLDPPYFGIDLPGARRNMFYFRLDHPLGVLDLPRNHPLHTDP